MCFGPSAAEKAAAEEQRVSAQEAKDAAAAERSVAKQDDISQALTSRTVRGYNRGGSGRRSLFTSMGGGSGYASRFN